MKSFSVNVAGLIPEYPHLDGDCIAYVQANSQLAALAALLVTPKETYTDPDFKLLNHITELDRNETLVLSFSHPGA